MNAPGLRVSRRRAAEMTIAEQHEYWQDVRRLSRRSFLKIGAVGAGAAVVGPWILRGGSAYAADGSSIIPVGRHIAFGADPSTEMNLAWQVPSAVTNPVVRIGTDPSDLGGLIAANLTDLNNSVYKPGTADQYYGHCPLTGLSPGTTYYYGVGHDGLDPASDSTKIYSFTTAPAVGGGRFAPFTFTAVGDQGTASQVNTTLSTIVAQNPVFHLLPGDISYADSSGSGSLSDSFNPTAWDTYFTDAEAAAKSIPWMVAMGNHDMEAWYSPDGYGGHLARMDFPGNGAASCPTTYSLRYANLGILSLDANDLSAEFSANQGYSGGAQTSWVGATLANFRADPTIDFIIVFFHQCAYGAATHGSEVGIRQQWCSLFDQYNVDLVVNAHSHVYERTDPIRNGSPTRTAPVGSTVSPVTDGTTYMVVGGGGQTLESIKGNPTFEGSDDYAGRSGTYDDSATTGAVDSITGVALHGGSSSTETVTWSRVRFAGFSMLAIDVNPAPPGGTSTLTLRAIATASGGSSASDDANDHVSNGQELDRLTISRTAQIVDTPEFGALPATLIGSAATAGVGYAAWRRHRSGLEVPVTV